MAEATADLTAMRALPRDQIPAFLQQLREAAMIGSGTVSGSQQAAPGTATQHTTCSDVARGAQPAALGDAFQQTACPDVVSGSPANLPKHTLVLEPSGRPACKKGRSADEESVGPAVAARPSSSVEALQTPQCKRRRFSEAGVVVGGGGLSPAMATRLAQSCRKSPVTLATPRTLEPQTPCGPPAEQQARDAEATEVRRLKSLVQPAVLKVFEYVSQKVINSGLRDFLPTASQDRTAYDHLAYLRGKHKQGLLTSDDSALLARTPQVLLIQGFCPQNKGKALRLAMDPGAEAVGISDNRRNLHRSSVSRFRRIPQPLSVAWLKLRVARSRARLQHSSFGDRFRSPNGTKIERRCSFGKCCFEQKFLACDGKAWCKSSGSVSEDDG